MKYWHQAAVWRPRLSKMGSDFGSAPGMWCDELYTILIWSFSAQRHLLMPNDHFLEAGLKSVIYNTIHHPRNSKLRLLLGLGRQPPFSLGFQTLQRSWKTA
jgi:hypothetical protein